MLRERRPRVRCLDVARQGHSDGDLGPLGHGPLLGRPCDAETVRVQEAVLRLLGETGLARRPLVELQAAERLGIRKAGGSLQALFNRLEGLHLIELFRPWDNSGAKAGGRTPDLVRLSEYGRLAYWLLAGADPVQNEYDALLARHVSPEHTLLNLQAADVLREAG